MTISDSQLAPAILDVLAHTDTGKGRDPHYLTAYQILRRLPDTLRAELIAAYGEPGKGNGRHFTAVSRVAQVARSVAEYEYLDAQGLTFEFGEGEDDDALSGYPVIGVYRKRR
jgi:hypothetical protein